MSQPTSPEPSPQRLSFTDTGLQWAWDATSSSALKECPRKYQYQIVQNWTGKGSSHHLTFGTLFHSALEEYHKHVAAGLSHEVAVRRVVRSTLEASGSRDLDRSGCPQCDGWAQPQVAEGRWRYVCSSCGLTGDWREGRAPRRFTPWDSGDTAKNRRTLLRSIVWYFEHYRDDPIKPLLLADGKPAVELSFRFDTGETFSDGTPIYFSGHLDLLGEMGSALYILDHKTAGSTLTSYYFDRYSPDNQMSMYTFAGKVITGREVRGVIIDAAQIAVGFTRFSRGFANRSPAQLEEWFQDTITAIRQAEHYHQQNYYPMNDKSCFNCPFQPICAKDPAVRDMYLRSNFAKREGWDPLRIR